MVIASSADFFPAQRRFAEHCDVTFQMAAGGPRQEAPRAFGVFDEERGMYRRVTFVIDRDGVVRHVIDEPRDMERHSREALEAVRGLA